MIIKGNQAPRSHALSHNHHCPIFHNHYLSVISDLLDNNLPLIEYSVCFGNYCFPPTYRPVDRSVHVLGHADIARAVCATRCARAGTAVVCVGVGCTDGGREFGCDVVEPDSRVLWRYGCSRKLILRSEEEVCG